MHFLPVVLPTVPTPSAAVTQLYMLDFSVGKGRQDMKCATAEWSAVCAGYVLESSSSYGGRVAIC